MTRLTEAVPECHERVLKALSDLPPFSPVLDRLLATLSSETISVAKISDIIETDTVIAGNVLKVVNSALYGRRGTVNSIRHAVSLLGINKLRNTVFAMSISRVWSQVRTAPGLSMARFNLHSVACALLCDALAQRASVEYPEGAFAAGLFHDLGALLIAVGAPAEFQEIENLRSSTRLSAIECEREVLGVSHADLSAEALALWNLPEAIQSAVRSHHEPKRVRASSATGPYRLSLVVRCAGDHLSAMKLTRHDVEIDSIESEPFLPLGIEMAHAGFLEDFEAELSLLSTVFH